MWEIYRWGWRWDYERKTSISRLRWVQYRFGDMECPDYWKVTDGRIILGSLAYRGPISKLPQTETNHKYPNKGLLLDSNPDGSELSFCRGVRKVRMNFVIWTKYGNIITADNDGDHRGESWTLGYILSKESDAGLGAPTCNMANIPTQKTMLTTFDGWKNFLFHVGKTKPPNIIPP